MPRRPLLVMLLLLAPAGCWPDKATRPTDATALLAGQPTATHAMTIDDFAVIAPRAVKQCHWAVLNKTDEVTAYRINAVTAAGSPVDIRARQVDADTIRLTVQAGRYGNADAERAFMRAFAEQTEKARREPD